MVVVITGANRGIGYEIAKRYAQNNYKSDIVMTSRDQKRGEQALNKLQFDFPNTKFVSLKLDICDAKNREKFYNHLEKEYGKIDVLINNAGVSDIRIDEILATNYYGTRDLTHELLPLIRDRVIVLSSMDSDDAYAECSEKVKFFLSENVMKPYELDDMVEDFQNAYLANEHKAKGFSGYNNGYGMSKVFARALCHVWTTENDHPDLYPHIKFFSCCPGWCKTEMGGEFAPQSVESGADNPYWLATTDDDDTLAMSGEFFRDEKRMVRWGQYC